MITKERLIELIEQGATIYELDINSNIYPLYLIDYQDVKIQEVEEYSLKRLYEHKEEAEWYKEFGCIERTERLELPTWEDVSKDFIPLKVASGQYPVVEFGDNSIEIIVNVNKDVQVVLWSDFVGNFVAPLTKENYTLACRKAKELFLGVKDE